MDREAFLELFGSDALEGVLPLTRGLRVFTSDAGRYAKTMFDKSPKYIFCSIEEYISLTPVYWEITRDGDLVGELIALPANYDATIPTALEYAVMEAFTLLSKEDFDNFLTGNKLLRLGKASDTKHFGDLIASYSEPKSGSTVLQGKFACVDLHADLASKFTKVAADCFASSFRTSPLKFRYLELYRVLEARFLHNILIYINQNFFSGPSECLAHATDKLASEARQIAELAKSEPSSFENIRSRIESMSQTNRFAAALKHKVAIKGKEFRTPQYATGAAYVYYTRCAIVHAGNKDIIFESYNDSNDLLESIFEELECAALLISGFSLR